MSFPTVRSNPYGEPKRPRARHLWSEREWRQRVLRSLRAIDNVVTKILVEKAISYNFTHDQVWQKLHS